MARSNLFPKAFEWIKLNFSDAFVLFDMKMHSNSTTLKFQRTRSFGSFEISNILSFKTTRPGSIKFYMQPSGKWGKKDFLVGL